MLRVNNAGVPDPPSNISITLDGNSLIKLFFFPSNVHQNEMVCKVVSFPTSCYIFIISKDSAYNTVVFITTTNSYLKGFWS